MQCTCNIIAAHGLLFESTLFILAAEFRSIYLQYFAMCDMKNVINLLTNITYLLFGFLVALLFSRSFKAIEIFGRCFCQVV